MNSKWHIRYLRQAEIVASWSKDPRKKCGAVITTASNFHVSQGFNGFPRRISDNPKDYADKALKLEKIIHAELNAILHAQCDLSGHKIYVWPLMPCARCAATIIQVGIVEVVFPYQDDNKIISTWAESQSIAADMFQEAGVKLIGIDLPG